MTVCVLWLIGVAQVGADTCPLCVPTARADEVLRTISVTGLGEVTAAPDIAHATVGVRTVAETARAALSENSTTIAAVLDALRGSGIADRDMQTNNVSLHPRWRTEVTENGRQARPSRTSPAIKKQG